MDNSPEDTYSESRMFEKISQGDMWRDMSVFFTDDQAFAKVLLFAAAVVTAYLLSKYVANGFIRIAQYVALRSDSSSNEEKFIRLRQVETYLSIAVAVVRALIVAVAAYVVWRIISPSTKPTGVAAIGASAFFIVFAGQTLGMLLRDITSGAAMIIEQWFNVGDYIKVEPFLDVGGVVERFNLRSTKLRSVSGEVIWINNQHMQAVHVTPRGVRTMAVDLFTYRHDEAKRQLERITSVVPTGPTLLPTPLRIGNAEKWDDTTWRFTIIGQTPPGREWLIEDFLVNAIKAIDTSKNEDERLFIFDPIARFADPVAEQKFRRAVHRPAPSTRKSSSSTPTTRTPRKKSPKQPPRPE